MIGIGSLIVSVLALVDLPDVIFNPEIEIRSFYFEKLGNTQMYIFEVENKGSESATKVVIVSDILFGTIHEAILLTPTENAEIKIHNKNSFVVLRPRLSQQETIHISVVFQQERSGEIFYSVTTTHDDGNPIIHYSFDKKSHKESINDLISKYIAK